MSADRSAVIVSACLLGERCYDGRDSEVTNFRDRLGDHAIIPVCPEVRGGLGTPRPSAEILGASVIRQDGTDVTAAFNAGSESCLRDGLEASASRAILKSRSPSCGIGEIYDGSFTATLVPGDGIFTRLLKSKGIEVISDEEWVKTDS